MLASEHAELEAFIAIAEERSFRRAAARLRLTPSTLSHSLRSLEARLGVRLLNRTTRTVAVTEAGARLLEEVAPAYRTVLAALESVNVFRDRPRGTVRLNVPRLAATLLISPKIAEFCRSYPDVSLEVTVSDDLIDVVKDGYDAGIRLEEDLDADMVAVPLGNNLRGAVVGSPEYFQQHPPPQHPRELAEHRCINRRHPRSGALHRWVFMRDGERSAVLGDGPLVSNADDLMLEAARKGIALAFLSETDVADDLASGRLIRVLEDWCPPLGQFYLYYPRNRNVSGSLRALIDTLGGRTINLSEP